MQLRDKHLLWLVLVILGVRLFGMIWIPLADTSEPRYAEIARLMAETGDWVTPWFEPGQPFWGKPPLSFWLQAASIKTFGLSEFAARLPSFLVTLITLVVVYEVARSCAGRLAAAWSAVVYVSCALTYIAMGAVLTDPFLTLGTTLAMAGIMLPSVNWRILGFFGLAIGLLAKGPLALVLIGGPCVLTWMMYRGRAWPRISYFVCASGIAAVLALVLPWYLLAEAKTPGFLNYFLVGEHFLRYVDPGWNGDLYGTAHVKPYGSIWLFWVMATFPWGVIALVAIVRGVSSSARRRLLSSFLAEPQTGHLVAWSVFTLLFFSLASNLLWTYALPAIPAFAILMGRTLAVWQRSARISQDQTPVRPAMSGGAILVPSAFLIFSIAVSKYPSLISTERDLVQYVSEKTGNSSSLIYIDSRPFSARFYSEGKAALLSSEKLWAFVSESERDVYIAIKRTAADGLPQDLPLELVSHPGSKKYLLARIHAGPSHSLASSQNFVEKP